MTPEELTDSEWREFQAIPDQGYSHRAWVDARIAERTTALLAEVERLTRRLNQDVGLLLGERDRALELSRSMAQEVHNAQARLDKVRAVLPNCYSSFDDTYTIPATVLQSALKGTPDE